MHGLKLDPLYSIFEQHLFTALVEGETTDDLLVRVVTDYVGHLKASGTVIPHSHLSTLESDLREEVLEMFRKKTYGHFDLTSYRKANGAEAALAKPLDTQDSTDQKEKARRGGRAC
jgi:hypothetical protein